MEICPADALGATSRAGNGEEWEMRDRFPHEN
jgi:hypothetical protein